MLVRSFPKLQRHLKFLIVVRANDFMTSMPVRAATLSSIYNDTVSAMQNDMNFLHYIVVLKWPNELFSLHDTVWQKTTMDEDVKADNLNDSVVIKSRMVSSWRHFRSLAQEAEVRHKELMYFLTGTDNKIIVLKNTSTVAEGDTGTIGESCEEFPSPSDEDVPVRKRHRLPRYAAENI